MLLAPSTLPMTERATTVDGELALDVFERCRGGDRAALTQFVQHYERRVFALLSRALGAGPRIDDLAQEVFIRAYQNIHKFDPAGTARLSTWLLTIAYRVVIDVRRRMKTQPAEITLETMANREQTSPEQAYSCRELNTVLTQAAATLPPEQRDVFILAEYHELELVEIGRITGTNPATVKTRLFRARARLRELLATVWEETR
jgi:RNA polymerase sigma factor (sigma-70 family)